MSNVSPLVYRLAGGEVEKLIVDGLRVKYEVFLQEPAELTFTLVDSDGRDVMDLTRVRVCSGDSVTLTGIDRALTVVVKPQEREVDLEAARLRAELAESQAREAGMREVLSAAEDAIGNFEGYEPLLGWVQDVIALPADHFALDALLAQARAEERERCAKVADGNYGWNGTSGKYEDDLGDAIRALGEKP